MAECTAGQIQCKLLEQADVLKNLAESLLDIQHLISGAAYVMGIGFIFKAIYALKAYGEGRTMTSSNASMKEPLVYLLVGAILLYLPTAVDVVLATTFGANAQILAYAPINSKSSQIQGLFGAGSPVGRPLTMLIQVIGLIAFIRGWVLIARASSQGQQPGGTGKGLMHVFGGIIALNIIKTMEVINATLYGG